MKRFGITLFKKMKDGGDKSKVTGYFLVEIKWLFSIVLLRFDQGTREASHSHAFHCLSWVLRGKLTERRLTTPIESLVAGCPRIYNYTEYTPSWLPFVTTRDNLHQVSSFGTSWVLTFRGPWVKTWYEIDEHRSLIELSHGRQKIKTLVATNV